MVSIKTGLHLNQTITKEALYLVEIDKLCILLGKDTILLKCLPNNKRSALIENFTEQVRDCLEIRY